MALTHTQALVLAAGKSSRFKTGKSKLLEPLCGKPIIAHSLATLKKLSIPTTVIVGFQKKALIEAISSYQKDISFVEQKEQNGTGHALMISKEAWNTDTLLVLNGDMPLVTQDIIEQLHATHQQKNASISFVTAHNCEPIAASYGRIVQDDNSIAIVEAKEFKGDITENCCINAGIYLINKKFLEESMQQLTQSSVTSEWYITDLVKIASDQKLTIATISAPFDRIRGINTFKELWAAEQILKADIINHWMNNGVRFSIAHNVHIDSDVTIGAGTVIESGAQLHGATTIGKNCSIGAFSIITESTLSDTVIVHPHTIISNSKVEDNAQIGPFAHVAEQSHIHDHAIVGNFVEIKRSTIGSYSKTKHLSYIGDTIMQERVNIGAGTITCNYDGTNKHQTVIESDAFIGSNNTLIAPLTIHKNAYTAAGSTLTQDVPENALALARTKQIIKPDYAHKLKTRNQDVKKHQEKELDQHFFGAVKSTNFETHS